MKGSKRKITPEFNPKVVLEVLREDMTLKELATKYGVAGTQISS